jgi:hypothetical protein
MGVRTPCNMQTRAMQHPRKTPWTCRRGLVPHLIYRMLCAKLRVTYFFDFALRAQLFHLHQPIGVVLPAPARAQPPQAPLD